MELNIFNNTMSLLFNLCYVLTSVVPFLFHIETLLVLLIPPLITKVSMLWTIML